MFEHLVVTAPISDGKLEELKSKFKSVSFHPDSEVDAETARKADIWYTTWHGFPKDIESWKQIPNTKAIQLSSAGANDCLKHPVFADPEAKERIKICSASGVHVLCIPQYVLCNVLNLYMQITIQTEAMRSGRTWLGGWLGSSGVIDKAKEAGWGYVGSRPLYGKTVGLLGYGHIARETARLFKAFNCRIIAATSNGSRRPAAGYEVQGLGDAEGALPEQFFSTADPAQLLEFASQCDVLVAVLPSTPSTRFLLTAQHFNAMPKDSIFVSVGRGDIARSEDIIAALDRNNGLLGAVLDVTDPEPLPDGHAIYSHPRIILTPHTSGNVEDYFDKVADVLLAQLEAVRAGKSFLNVVDTEKGY